MSFVNLTQGMVLYKVERRKGIAADTKIWDKGGVLIIIAVVVFYIVTGSPCGKEGDGFDIPIFLK